MQSSKSVPVENLKGEAAPATRKPCMEATETHTDTIEKQRIKFLWTALQVAEGQIEKRGLQFGEALYTYRERSEVVPGGTTFRSTLDKLNIPPTTAYRWIAIYEESIGTRLPKPNPPSRPNETTSYDVKVEAEPTVRATSIRDVSPSDCSSSAKDDLPLDSEPESTPRTLTPTPVVSTEGKEREQLCFLVKRLSSICIALQQVVDGKVKWSKHAEYAKVVSLGVKIADLVKLLPDNQKNFIDERLAK
jgi:hypothetical protein